MVESHTNGSRFEVSNTDIQRKIKNKLRFVVKLPERSGYIGIVNLPVRFLGIAHPQITDAPENSLQQLGFEAQLKFSFVLLASY